MAAAMIGRAGTDVTTKHGAEMSGLAAQPATGSRKATGEILARPAGLGTATGSIETATGTKAVTRNLGRQRSSA